MTNVAEPNLTTCFLYYYRYVHDILVYFAGTETQFIQFINDIHPKLTFIIEIEISFLFCNLFNLTTTKSNSKHKFSICMTILHLHIINNFKIILSIVN